MDILDRIREGLVEGDTVVPLVEEALHALPAADILEKSLVVAMEKVGELWKDGTYFLPDIVLATEAFKEALEILTPHLTEGEAPRRGRYLIGVVRGDVHDLGKSIVITMLTSGGFEVIDLGIDVPVEVFVEKVRELEPDILGIGAYMSTTMLLMKEVIKALEEAGLRDKVKVMVGGVPITPGYAQEVGADSYGRDALEALENSLKLMGAG